MSMNMCISMRIRLSTSMSMICMYEGMYVCMFSILCR